MIFIILLIQDGGYDDAWMGNNVKESEVDLTERSDEGESLLFVPLSDISQDPSRGFREVRGIIVVAQHYVYSFIGTCVFFFMFL